MELEGRFRRAAAERGAVELKKNEFQGELKKQMEQIEHIQSLHNVQLENTNKMHRDEKVRALFFCICHHLSHFARLFLTKGCSHASKTEGLCNAPISTSSFLY